MENNFINASYITVFNIPHIQLPTWKTVFGVIKFVVTYHKKILCKIVLRNKKNIKNRSKVFDVDTGIYFILPRVISDES